ncbi:MAG: hypothetical protein KF778_15675 [Rhodocyclaceae bacterium]|nr:hypothetical protein [Rhodocyclaceae bacterium]
MVRYGGGAWPMPLPKAGAERQFGSRTCHALKMGGLRIRQANAAQSSMLAKWVGVNVRANAPVRYCAKTKKFLLVMDVGLFAAGGACAAAVACATRHPIAEQGRRIFRAPECWPNP